MRTAFEAEGDVRGTDILAGLVTLWRSAGSGSLHFSRSGASAGFDLAEGEIVGVSSSDPRFETAAILVRAGKLDASTLERLPIPAGTERARAAVMAGLLTRREWRWGEKIRAVEVLSDLLTWLEGEYVLEPGAPDAAGEFRLTIPRLVLELFLRSRDRGLVLHYLGGVDVPLVRAPNFDGEFATFGLTSDAESVVRLIDGEATAAEIAAEGPADSFAVEKLLAALATLGLVHPEFAAERASAPPAQEPERPGRQTPESREPEGQGEQEEMPGEFERLPAAVPEPGEPREQPGDSDRDYEIAAEPLVSFEEPPRVETPGDLSEAVGEAPLHADEPEEPEALPVDFESEEPPVERELEIENAWRPSTPEAGSGVSVSDADPRTGGRHSAAPWLWLIVVLAAGVAAVMLLRRSPAESAAGGLVVTAAPSPIAAAEAVPSPPSAATAQPPATAPAPRPTAAASRSTPSAPRPTAVPASSREPSPGDSRSAWLARAARDHRRLAADRKTRYAIQLELACETPSLVEAWKYDRPPGTMWVLASPYQGRTCFRVLWGRYPARDAARRGISGAPAFFSNGRNHPMVTAVP